MGKGDESKEKKLYAAFMDLEKAYDRINWLALWEVLKIYGVGGKLLSAIKSFYEEASACVKISGETSEHSEMRHSAGICSWFQIDFIKLWKCR